MLFLGRMKCAESGNSICLSVKHPEVEPKLKMLRDYTYDKLVRILVYNEFELLNRK